MIKINDNLKQCIKHNPYTSVAIQADSTVWDNMRINMGYKLDNNTLMNNVRWIVGDIVWCKVDDIT
jgi:hypothetical protein